MGCGAFDAVAVGAAGDGRAGHGIAAEADTCAGSARSTPEGHQVDDDSSAEIVREVVLGAEPTCRGTVPRRKDRLDRFLELSVQVGWDRPLGFLDDDPAQRIGGGIEHDGRRPLPVGGACDCGVDSVRGHPPHRASDVDSGLEANVGGKPLASPSPKCCDRIVGHADIEHGVHEARHRHDRAGSHRKHRRPIGRRGDRFHHANGFLPHRCGQVSRLEEPPARERVDGKAGHDREAHGVHLGERSSS